MNIEWFTNSLNNSNFAKQIERINHITNEIKTTADTTKSISYLDLHLKLTMMVG